MNLTLERLDEMAMDWPANWAIGGPAEDPTSVLELIEYARERAAREACEHAAYPTHTVTLTHEGHLYQARAIDSSGRETSMIASGTVTTAYLALLALLEEANR